MIRWIRRWLQRQQAPRTIYRSPVEIIRDMLDNMSEESYNLVRSLKEPSDMVQFHFTTGMSIRNRHGMWEQENPWTDARFANSVRHPDNLSGLILEAVWYCLNRRMQPATAFATARAEALRRNLLCA